MHENKLAVSTKDYVSQQDIDLDTLEEQLSSDIEEQMQELEGLEKDFEKIGDSDSLGSTVMSVVWEQFINQIGVVAGEDFIKENRNLKLDLRNEAHIQTTENFAQGKIASHNTGIDYQQRYTQWQANFQHNEDGTVKTHTTRTGKQEPTLLGKSVRAPFDKGRPTGSTQKGTDMDHTVSANEILCDAAANAHLIQKEQIDFANGRENLKEMISGHNRSKKQTPTTVWLDTPNSRGQTPREIFQDLTPELEQQYRQNDKEARQEYQRVKAEGEKRSVQTGRKSQKAEAFRIGGKALRAAVMGILADLTRTILRKLIAWFRSANKKFQTLITGIKEAIHEFMSSLKQHLATGAQSMITSISTAISGPIIRILGKTWSLLKQGYKSVKEAIGYLKNPENSNKPFSLKMLEVGKIIIAGLSVGGALILGQLIETGLSAIPGFGVQIPLLGSLANILGIFFGAVIAGIIGALVLHLINKMIVKKQKRSNIGRQIDTTHTILQKQDQLKVVVVEKVDQTKYQTHQSISERHHHVKEEMGRVATSMKSALDQTEQAHFQTQKSHQETEQLHRDTVALDRKNTDTLANLFKDLEI